MTVVQVAAVRMAPILGETEANRSTTVQAIERAVAIGARLVVLPELASSGYCFVDAAEARSVAERIPGPTTAAWQAAAAPGVVIVGGICELDRAGQLRNSAVVVDHSGVRAVYRKLHLWGIEKRLFVAGDELPPLVTTDVGKIGVGICYDLWFPELARELAARGAEILAYPSNLSASPAQDGLPHLDVVVAVSTAHVNGVHLVLADRCGRERGEDWLGAALVVGADGTLLAGPPPGDLPTAVHTSIDPARARDKSWGPANDLLDDRRADLYG